MDLREAVEVLELRSCVPRGPWLQRRLIRQARRVKSHSVPAHGLAIKKTSGKVRVSTLK
jgi:hypothetical protein